MLCLRGGLSPTLTKRLVGALAVDGKWSYKLHSIPHVPKGSGSFKASAGGSSHLSTILAIGASGGNPTVTAQSTDCSLHLSVKTSGSLFSWLYNLIIKAFQGTINHQICSAAKEGVNNVIQTTLTKALKQLNLNIAVPLPKALQRPGFALAVDLRLTSNPTVTSSSIAVPIRAECRNTAKPGPSTVAPALPTFGGHLSSSHLHHIRLNTSFPASNDTPRALQPRRVHICFLPRCDLSGKHRCVQINAVHSLYVSVWGSGGHVEWRARTLSVSARWVSAVHSLPVHCAVIRPVFAQHQFL